MFTDSSNSSTVCWRSSAISPLLRLAQRVGLVGRLAAALLALHDVAGVVVGGVDLLAADLGGGGEPLLYLAVGLALRGVPLHPVALLELLGHNAPLLCLYSS